MTDTEKIATLKSIIATHEKYRKSYFWSSPQNASARRYMEFDLEYNIDGYTIQQKLTCSCRNIYFHTSVVDQDGNKKDIRSLKKLLAKISE